MQILNFAEYYSTTQLASFLIVLAFCLINCCASQRSFVSLGTKLEKPTPSSSNSNRKQRKSFFGAAAAEADIKDEINEAMEVVMEEEEQSDLLESCEVGFEGIKLTLQQKKKPERHILDGSLKGKAKPGRMLAIMGPSGSGKSNVFLSKRS